MKNVALLVYLILFSICVACFIGYLAIEERFTTINIVNSVYFLFLLLGSVAYYLNIGMIHPLFWRKITILGSLFLLYSAYLLYQRNPIITSSNLLLSCLLLSLPALYVLFLYSKRQNAYWPSEEDIECPRIFGELLEKSETLNYEKQEGDTSLTVTIDREIEGYTVRIHRYDGEIDHSFVNTCYCLVDLADFIEEHAQLKANDFKPKNAIKDA